MSLAAGAMTAVDATNSHRAEPSEPIMESLCLDEFLESCHFHSSTLPPSVPAASNSARRREQSNTGEENETVTSSMIVGNGRDDL